MEIPSHLGGHLNKTHLDFDALLFLKNKFNVRTMIDIGCGPGGMVELAEDKFEIDAYGIDGDWTVLPKWSNFFLHDFTKGKYNTHLKFDLGWSVEFLEHVSEEFQENYMSLFKKCRYAVVTHALPHETGGHHHVNCRDDQYWIDVFKDYEFEYDPDTTAKLKQVSSMTKKFIERTGKFFINNKW